MIRAILAAVLAVSIYNISAEPFAVITDAVGASQELIMAIIFAFLIKPWIEETMEN